MWRVTVRDLCWRRRRVAIAVVGTALVFAMTLLMAGLAQGFRSEVDRTLGGIAAERWVVPAGSSGPFSALSTVAEHTVDDVGREPGVTAAAPVILLHQTVRADAGNDRITDVMVVGVTPHLLGNPRTSAGSAIAGAGEAVVDDTLGYQVGERILIGGNRMTIVGTTHGMTLNAGTPDVFISLVDAQSLAFGGRRIVTGVLTRGIPQLVPANLVVLDNAAVKDDLLRPLSRAVRSLDVTQWLLWAVAATIIASVVYLSATERIRDFAVLKAMGASSASVIGSVALQSEVMSIGAAALAMVIAVGLVPIFPLAIGSPVAALVALPVVAVVVGLLACLVGVRRVLTVDPLIALTGPA